MPAIMQIEGKQLRGKKDELQLKDLQQELDVAAGDAAQTVGSAVANQYACDLVGV